MHEVSRQIKRLILGGLLLAPLLIDQGIKLLWLEKGFFDWGKAGEKGETGEILCNPGVAWGIEFNKFLIIILNIFILVVLIWAAGRTKWLKEKIVLVLLIGAALSNLGDRVVRGCVVDYIDVGFWPVFNGADLVISGAVLYWVVMQLKRERRRKGDRN